MSSSLTLKSIAPHDFTLTLDVQAYFETEYDVQTIFEKGYARPLCLETRDVLSVSTFNGDPDDPEFEVWFPHEALTSAEQDEALAILGRILGTELDTAGFLAKVEGDDVLEPLALEHYGFKRLARANFYEDALRRLAHSRISHEPTRKRMVQDVRKAWGTAWTWEGETYYSYPRPDVMADVEPQALRDIGLSLRKGEYITGLAKHVVDNPNFLQEMETCDPDEFLDRAESIRGIGPSLAQMLLLSRGSAHGVLRTRLVKGEDKGLRAWIFPKFGTKKKGVTHEQARAILERFEGYEALATSYFYFDWMNEELRKKHEKSEAQSHS